MTSFALQREQLGQRGPIRLGDIIPLCPRSSGKGAETTARLLSPDRQEVWGRNAFSGIRMKGRMSHMVKKKVWPKIVGFQPGR